jgi:hypothetical protein
MGAKSQLEKFAKFSPIIADLLDRIKGDSECVEMIRKSKGKLQSYSAVFRLLPYFVKYDEFYELIGVYFGKTAEEIENESIQVFNDQIKTMSNDKTFTDFFQSTSQSQK